MKAEQGLQPLFSFLEFLQALAVGSLTLLAAETLPLLPDRVPLTPRVSAIRFDPVAVPAVSGQASYRLVGAWNLTSDDPRFGGFSGLALDGVALIGLTDSGAIARLPKPLGQSVGSSGMNDLPDGPRDQRYRLNRDTEALVSDRYGRGWWVSFEQENELWLYDPAFRKAIKRLRFGKWRWPENGGIEGMAWAGADLLLGIEDAPTLFRVHASRAVGMSFSGKSGSLSDATRLPDGRLATLERELSWRGFHNALLIISEEFDGFRVSRRMPLPAGALDNLEGMAAERLPSGAIRVWMISDDNFQRPLRTLLIAIDLPPEGRSP
jgi:hypothetical protein